MNFTAYQIKCALVVFLCVYAVFGAIILIVFRYVSTGYISSLTDHNLNLDSATLVSTIDVSIHANYLLYKYFLVWGVVIFIFVVYGACSVFSENIMLIKGFGFLLLITASMKVPVAAYSLFQVEISENALLFAKSDMWNNFERSNTDIKSATARDYIQDVHICCGVNSYEDYDIFKMKEMVYPKSCCFDNSEDCHSSSEVKQTGCAEKVAKTYLHAYRTMGGMSLFVIILEVLATTLAFYLPYLIRKRKGRLSNVR